MRNEDDSWLLSCSDNRIMIFFWNMIGAGLFAVQAAIILIVIARKYSTDVAGIITIAYAISNLSVAVGKYGVRNYQATDVLHKYSFDKYLRTRVLTCLISITAVSLYILIMVISGRYAIGKGMIIFEVVILKGIDTFADVYLGEYQRNGRFIVAAKIMSIQQMTVTLAIVVSSMLGMNMEAVFIVGILVSIIVLAILILATRSCLHKQREMYEAGMHKEGTVKGLIKECLPLCAGMTLEIYIGNVPKYAIDLYLDDSIQAVFGYLMLPVFVVTLLNQFIYQPYVKELGDMWNEGLVQKIKKKLISQCMIVVGISIMVLFGCVTIGLSFMSILYNTNLTVFTKEFVILLIGGSFNAIAFYFTIPLTVMRQQRFVAIGYILVSLVAVTLQKKMALAYGVDGISWLYVIINLLLLLFYGLMLVVKIEKKE